MPQESMYACVCVCVCVCAPILRFYIHFKFLYTKPNNSSKVPENVAYTEVYNCLRRHLTEIFQQDRATVHDVFEFIRYLSRAIFPPFI